MQVVNRKTIGLDRTAERAVHLRMPRELYVKLRVEAVQQDIGFGKYCINRLQQAPHVAAAEGHSYD